MGYCRARLTPFGHRLLVDRILELGWPVAQAAESVGVSRQTAYQVACPSARSVTVRVLRLEVPTAVSPLHPPRLADRRHPPHP